MRKSVKGALAAAAGAALLVGGAGTLATWSSENTVTGTDVNGGRMSLGTDATAPGCGEWTLDSAEAGGTTYADGDPLVPGDVLSKVCTYRIHASGNHLRATVGLSQPSFSGTDGSFGGNLAADVALKLGGVPVTEFTSADDGQALVATVSVTWNHTDTGHQDAATVLDDLTLTAQQVHD